MGYAIVGYFDEMSDTRIRVLWNGMADIGVDDYLINSKNNPHFKFAVYEYLDVDKVKMLVSDIAKSYVKIPVQFKSYSFYPGNQFFVNIDIAVSFEILDLQKRIRTECDINAKMYNVDYFNTGIWKPDCQLTIEFDKGKLPVAIEYLSNTYLPFNGMINRLGIIEFYPAIPLASYELRK